MTALFDDLPAEAREKLHKKAQPSWTSPMLATLTHEPVFQKGWIYEPKLDGERCLAFKQGSEVRLMSRNRKLISTSYPEVVEAISQQRGIDFTIDGEIVAFDGELTSFHKLQPRMQVQSPTEALRAATPVFYYVFDILYLDGYDTTHLELLHRKQLLRHALSFKSPLHFTTHVDIEGEAYYRAACRKGWEGLIAKNAGSAYVSSRSRDWLKFKCTNRQEFVIGGYTDPGGQRIGFGALLLGYYEGEKLRYAGKVGTGFSEELLGQLGRELKSIERDTSPFSSEVGEKGAHWVSPKLVGEISFTEWTGSGSLRHPSFLGLRRDKTARQVTREG
jgi:bifunctional non-homologous end joining protein LigD